jgi:hypothetical protein
LMEFDNGIWLESILKKEKWKVWKLNNIDYSFYKEA